MLKVKVRWAGFQGSPGWSNFYFDDASGDFLTNTEAIAAQDKVSTFLLAIRSMFPTTLNWTIQSDVEHVHATTGAMFGIESTPARAAIAGTATTNPYSAATGAVITWRTALVRNGRRVRGRTFLVPCALPVYGTDGTLEAASLTLLQNAATALQTPNGDFGLGVWARPTAPGLEDGDWAPVAGATVPDKVAVLRSRRD